MVGDSFLCQNMFSGTLLSSDVWKTKVVKLCDGLGVVSRSAVVVSRRAGLRVCAFCWEEKGPLCGASQLEPR